MPRVVRDSDEDAEPKTIARRTRASSAASSASFTDSPVRRNTRSAKQLATIESSPESLDDSSAQPRGRTTRSRAATLDKGTAASTVKNLRSRKNSNTSDLSESIEVVDVETISKKVTRKTAASTGTPTKTNARTRNLRAGSEAKSTPPISRTKRVTRASSVDPVNVLNESIGTPVKRRTRASMVPLEPTVTEEKVTKEKDAESLETTVAEIEEGLEITQESGKGKSTKKLPKTKKKTEKDANDGKSVIAIDESSNDSKISESGPSITATNKMDSKYIFIQTDITGEPSMQSDGNSVVSFDPLETEKKNYSGEPDISTLMYEKKLESKNIVDDKKKIIDKSKENDEIDVIDVEGLNESTLSDDDIVVIDFPKKSKHDVDLAIVNLKGAYVKLERAEAVEKIMFSQINDPEMHVDESNRNSNNDIVSQNDVIKNAKTAIILVNDFVDTDGNRTTELKGVGDILPTEDKKMNIDNLKINSDSKDDSNSNLVENEDDDKHSIKLVVEDDDNDISSDSGIQTNTDNLPVNIVEKNDKVKNIRVSSKNEDRSFMDEINDLENLITNDDSDTNGCGGSIVVNSQILNNQVFENKTNELITTRDTELFDVIENEIPKVSENFDSEREQKSESGISKSIDNEVVISKDENYDMDVDIEGDGDSNSIPTVQSKTEIIGVSNTSIISNSIIDKNEVVSVTNLCDTSMEQNNTSEDNKDITSSYHEKNFVETQSGEAIVPIEQNNYICGNFTLLAQSGRGSSSFAEVKKTVDEKCIDNKISNDETNQASQIKTKFESSNVEADIEENNVVYRNENIEITEITNADEERTANSSCIIESIIVKDSLVNENENIEITEITDVDEERTGNSTCIIESNIVKDSLGNESENTEIIEIDSIENNELQSVVSIPDTNLVTSSELKNIEFPPRTPSDLQKNNLTANDRDLNKVTDNEERIIVVSDEHEMDSNEAKPDTLTLSNTGGCNTVKKIDTNKNEPDISETDKNSISSTVTDADGEDASTSENLGQTNAEATTSPKKVDYYKHGESDIDESAADLFQDIPAEEWSQNRTIDATKTTEESTLQESQIECTKKRKSLDKSHAKESPNDSLTRKSRRSMEKKCNNNQDCDSTIQESNKTVIEIDENDSEKDENLSPNKSRRSENKSPKANQSLQQNKSLTEESLNDGTSSSKNRNLNVSMSNQNETSLNTSKNSRRGSLADTSRKLSLIEEQEDEKMEVDEEPEHDEYIKSRKSLNKSKLVESESKKESASDKLSISLDTSKSSKRKSAGKSLELTEEEVMSNFQVNKSVREEVNTQSPNRSRRSLNKSSPVPNKNESVSEKFSTSLNDTKNSKKLNVSSRKSLAEVEEQNDSSDGGAMEVDEVSEDNEKSFDRSKNLSKSLGDKSNAEAESSSNKKNVSLKEISPRKSLSKSTDIPSIKIDRSSNSDDEGNKQRNESLEKKILNTSTRSQKSAKNTPVKSSSKNTTIESSNDEEGEEEDETKSKVILKRGKLAQNTLSKVSVEKSTIESDDENEETTHKSSSKKDKRNLNESLQKSIDRMKYINPPKHDLSTLVQVDSSSDDDSKEVPSFIFRLSDSDATRDSTDDEEEDDSDDEMDSDIAKDYNLAGKDKSKYSDDDVPGDDCRVSEEEFSDSEDDGEDLKDFLVDDDEVENDDEDEDEAEEEEDDSDVEVEKSELKNRGEGLLNYSKSSVKNTSVKKSPLHDDENSGSESDSEAIANEIENMKGKSLNKSKSMNVSKSTSKLQESSAQSISDSDGEKIVQVNVSKVSMKDKSINASKSVNEKSMNLSKIHINLSKSNASSEYEEAEIQNRRNVSAGKISGTSKSLDNTSEDLSKSRKQDDSSSRSEEEAATANKSTISLKEKNKSMNKSKSILKDKSMNSSKPQKPADQNSVSEKEGTTTLNKSKEKNKSINQSKSVKDKSINRLNDSKLNNSKNVSFAHQDDYESSDSQAEEDETSYTNVQSSSESESEAGEDSYRIITVNGSDMSQLKSKNKKLAPLMECSTPKPGISKKTDFSKDNLSITTNKSLSTKRKSGSLNDLTEPKCMSVLAEAHSKSIMDKVKPSDTSLRLKSGVEFVSTPESIIKNREGWKLIPLSRTINPSGDETPTTKYLKKTKLNNSSPLLESMRSVDLSELKNPMKNEKVSSESPEKVEKKSKKRKLEDTSNVQSIDDDSVLVVTKKKKRPRIEDTTIIEDHDQDVEVADVSENKKKRKKNKQVVELEETEGVEKVTKKTKKNKIVEQVKLVENPKKKKKKNQENVGIEEEVSKSKKKKAHQMEENQGNVETEEKKCKKKKKLKKELTDGEDDDAPESLGFKEARLAATTEMQLISDGIKAQKESRKAKHDERKCLKRLPEDIVEGLSEEPQIRRPDKRQKLAPNRERNVVMPSKSMFSPGKIIPANLEVEDGFVPLSSAGGTTDFGIVNLQKVKKSSKKNIAVLNFRQKMLARNSRLPVPSYLSIMKKQKAKNAK